MMSKGHLAGNLGDLVYIERRIQMLDGDSTDSLDISSLDDERGIPLADLADLVLAGWNRSNVGPLISVARAISTARPGFLDMVRGRRFRDLVAIEIMGWGRTCARNPVISLLYFDPQAPQ
jgi:hypothetical protein